MKSLKCSICGFIYEGEEPPEFCPVCNYGRDKFMQIANYKKGKLRSTLDNKNEEENK